MLALAIGVGANAGVFTVVNTLLLRSLPFREPGRLAFFQLFIPPHDTSEHFQEWLRQSPYLENAALYEEKDSNFGGGTGPANRIHFCQTSWNFFSTLGIEPVIGRPFLPGEDATGRLGAVIISYGLWQQAFAGDKTALGSTLHIDGAPYTIVGVAPRGFDYPDRTAVWRPAIFSPGNHGWRTVARLKPGIAWPQARAAFAIDVDRYSPKPVLTGRVDLRPAILPLQDALAGPAKEASLLFMGAAVLVLLVACTNIANLLIARTADRAAELRIRSALGASRRRLARQSLAECWLLSLAATIAGLFFAAWTAVLAAKVQPPPLGAPSYSILEFRVLAFTFAVSLLATSIFGLFPALVAGRISSHGLRVSAGAHRLRFVRESLAAAQVAFTIILLAASVSVGRAFVHLIGNDRGYQVANIVTVSVSLDGTSQEENHHQLSYFEDVLSRIRSIPGVRSASATEFLPLYTNGFVGAPFGLDGRVLGRNSTIISVASGFFETMGGQILFGREFTDAEVRSGARVAVVNERFASAFGNPSDAVGRDLTRNSGPPRKIIGVVKGIEFETDPTLGGSFQVFLPSQTPGSFLSTFVARVEGRAEDHLALIRDTVSSVDPQVPVFGAQTMKQRLDAHFALPEFSRTAVWTFAAIALLLAVIGIYGIVSYAVVQRSRELGVRMALGGTPSDVRLMLLRQGLLPVVAGAIFGMVGAEFAGQVLGSLMPGAAPVGPAALTALLAFVALVTAGSIWSATRPITGLDIVVVLGSE